MKLTIIGDMPQPITRLQTGWHSFDKAFTNPKGVLGFPVRGMVEIYGVSGCGKTTFTLSLASRLAQILKRNMVFADIEKFDPEHAIAILEGTGFEQGLKFIAEKTDEQSLDEILESILNDDVAISVFDSVGAVSPLAEQSGEIGEANWGRRAMILGQFSRKFTHLLEELPTLSTILINHMRPRQGGRGWETPGGTAIEFLSQIRIHLSRGERFSDGSYTVQGTIKKNRYGFEQEEFEVFILAGQGIHDGMTALMDCKKQKLISGNWKSIRIGEEKFGQYASIVNKARSGDTEFFKPFHEILEKERDVENE